ncbi:MAG: HlyD family efflux transporter periplasmic adaptor subunit [Betaproteobacteria bacterium]|nr:HlyD family efflux transporter periplasmic adaptor subunit [Betaproteobacteria bacterium]
MTRPALARTVPIVLAVFLAACDGSGPDTTRTSPGATRNAAAQVDPLLVTADAALARRIAVTEVTTAEYREPLTLRATARAMPGRVVAAHALVAGRVTEIRARVGRNVDRNEILALIDSPEIAAAQQRYVRAFAARTAATSAASEATRLFENDAIPAAEVEAREHERARTAAALRDAHDELVRLGVDEAEILALEGSRAVASRSYIVAPTQGTVVGLNVREGDTVKPRDDAFLVADLGRVWVEATPAPGEAPAPLPGEPVGVRAGTPDARELRGTVVTVDASEPSAGVIRVAVDNPDHVLAPGVVATISLLDRPRVRTVIPVTAILHEGARDYVYRRDGPDRYRLVPVFLGAEAEGVRPVSEGLVAGDVIVTRGVAALEHARRQNLQ